MDFFLRTIRVLLLSVVVLASSFALAMTIKTGELPTVESSRGVLSTALPFLDDSCRFPLRYRIGSIDSNFHLSREDFSKAIHEAEGIWEKGTGEDLFEEHENTYALPINLVFDNRQERTDSLKEVSSDIDTRKAAYEQLRGEYELSRRHFDQKKMSYDANVKRYEKNLKEYEDRVRKYNEHLRSYEKLVAQWNAEGGAPPDEYEELEDERKSLKKEVSAIEKARDDINGEKTALEKELRSLNALSGEVNTIAGSLNRMASALNLTVDTFNEVFGMREEFTTGLYTKDKTGTRIDVFQFYDHADLVLILAHEMGHALGIEHAAENASIMYPSISGQQPTLTDEDRRLFESVCSGA